MMQALLFSIPSSPCLNQVQSPTHIVVNDLVRQLGLKPFDEDVQLLVQLYTSLPEERFNQLHNELVDAHSAAVGLAPSLFDDYHLSFPCVMERALSRYIA